MVMLHKLFWPHGYNISILPATLESPEKIQLVPHKKYFAELKQKGMSMHDMQIDLF